MSDIAAAINAERLQEATRLLRMVRTETGQPSLPLIQEVEQQADALARQARGMGSDPDGDLPEGHPS